MFANQVSTYCKNKANANASQCKRNMMVYGMSKLNGMEESHLDAMDPFQKDGDAIRKYLLLLSVFRTSRKKFRYEEKIKPL
jgi:hypothetical protein